MKLLLTSALFLAHLSCGAAFALQPTPAKLALRKPKPITPSRPAAAARASDVSMLDFVPIAQAAAGVVTAMGLIVTMGAATVVMGSAEFRLPLAQKLGGVEQDLDDVSAWCD